MKLNNHSGIQQEHLLENSPKSGINKLFRHSAIYSISTSIQRLQGLIMMPIYTSTQFLPQLSEYSNYGLVYTFIAFMNFVYFYGMDSAFLRYFFLGKADRKTVFSTTFWILLISSITTSILISIFSTHIAKFILFSPNLAPLIRLAALILLFDTMGNLPYLILRVEERPIKFTIFRMIRFFIELVLNIVFVVILKKGVIGILYANVLAAVINLLFMLPVTLKYFKSSINFSLLKEMVYFGVPFLPNGIAFITIEMADRFLVTKYLGKDILAFYHANYKFAAVLLLFIIGFRHAWQPFFLKIAKDKEAPLIYARTLSYYFILALTISIFVLFFARDLLTIRYFNLFYILGTEYWVGIPFIPWIVLSYVFYGVYIILTPAFYITKKSQYMIIFTGTGAMLNIIVNIILLPKIGIWGAVVATLIAYLAMAASIYVIAQKIYPIPVEKKKMTVMLLLIGIFYIFCYIFDLVFISRLAIFLLYLFIIFRFGLSISDRMQIKSLLSRGLIR